MNRGLMGGESTTCVRVSAENQWGDLRLDLKAQFCRGQPKSLRLAANRNVVVEALRLLPGGDGKVRATSQGRQRVQLNARYPGAREIPVKEADALPTDHREAHQAQ